VLIWFYTLNIVRKHLSQQDGTPSPSDVTPGADHLPFLCHLESDRRRRKHVMQPQKELQYFIRVIMTQPLSCSRVHVNVNNVKYFRKKVKMKKINKYNFHSKQVFYLFFFHANQALFTEFVTNQALSTEFMTNQALSTEFMTNMFCPNLNQHFFILFTDKYIKHILIN